MMKFRNRRRWNGASLFYCYLSDQQATQRQGCEGAPEM
jgi:hypothetical protein